MADTAEITIKDAEFEAFCAELKSETPDMGKIKAGMEKYGLGQLSDVQKAKFLAAMFPAPVAKGAKETEKLGFQNLNGIKNALSAMQQLQAEGKIGDKEMLQFLTEANPKNGRNVMTTVALNTWAAEVKDKHIKEPDARGKLYKNTQSMVDIQEMLGNLSPEVFAQAANTPDETKGVGGVPMRKVKYRDMMGKSFMMHDNAQKIESELAKIDAQVPRTQATLAPLTMDAVPENSDEEPYRIGGTENTAPLTVGGETNTPLNVQVQTPPENQEEDENQDKVATLENPGPDSDMGKSDWHITPVEQQDIIDYMFKTWVIGGMNLGLEYTFKGAEYLVNALLPRKGSPTMSSSASANAAPAPRLTEDTPTPETPHEGGERSEAHSSEPNPTSRSAEEYIDKIIATGRISSQMYTDVLSGGAGKDAELYLAALAQTVKNNIGKDIDHWKSAIFIGPDGKQEVPFEPSEHKDLVKQLDALYRNDKDAFMKRIQSMPKALKNLSLKNAHNMVVAAAQLSAVEYAATHLGDPLEAKATNKVRAKTLGKANELLETYQMIQQKNALEILRDPTRKPTPDEKKQIEKATQKEYDQYMAGVFTRVKTLRDLSGAHFAETDTAKKAALEQQIQEAYRAYQAVYDKYRNPNGDETRDKSSGERQEKQTPLPGPVDLKNAAVHENQTDKLNQEFKDFVTGGFADVEERRTQNNERQQNFVEKRDQILGHEQAQHNNTQKFFNHVFNQQKGGRS